MSAQRSDKIALCLFGALAGIGLVRATTMHARTPWWDLDPLLSPPAETGLLVSGQLLLDAFVWLIAGVCAVWAAVCGQRVRVWLGLLVCIGAFGVLLHGRFLSPFVADGGVNGDFRSLVVGSAWVSALVGAWAMAHLVRAEVVRRIAPGVLGGLAVMLLARGALQVFVEHAMTVRAFDVDPAAYLARAGMEPGTSVARVFERRLRHPDAVGWFGLSNVYAGVAAGCAVMLIGALLGGGRVMGRWTRWVVALGAVAALGCVALSASKGGVAAVGIGVLIATVALRHHGGIGRRLWGTIGVGCIFGVIALVALRGAVGERIGELSLLFRWQYLVGAARIAGEFPVFGCGPARFQDAYLLYKVPTNPEEIERAHNVIADWVATLGVFGWAMVCVLVRLAWDAGVGVWGSVSSRDRGGEMPSPDLASLGHPLPGKGEGAESAGSVHGNVGDGALARWVLAVVGLSVAASIWVEQDALEAVGASVRLGACCVWIGLAVALARAGRSARWAGVGLGAAALAFVAHGQIEVGMVQGGSAAWIFLVIGAGAGMRGSDMGGCGKKWSGTIGCGAGIVGCAAVVWWGVVPASKWEADLASAAGMVGERLENGTVHPDVLDEAGGVMWVSGNAFAGDDVDSICEALRLSTLAELGRGGKRDAETMRGFFGLVVLLPRSSKLLGSVASSHEAMASGSDDRDVWRAVAEAWERVGKVEPYGVESRRRAMLARVRAGDLGAAQELGAEVLRLDALYRLDPMKRLSDEQRREVEAVAN